MRDSVDAHRATAVLFANNDSDGVKVIFETPYGTRCWKYSKEKRGDAWRLGEPRISNDEERLSLLWVPPLQMN